MTTVLLSQNLQELWNAVETTAPDENQPLPLIANLSGTRVYDKRIGYGRLWSWFYSFVGLFCGDKIKNQKLKQAVIKTHELFQAGIDNLGTAVDRFHDNLCLLSEGCEINENHYNRDKKRITQWNLATKPFVKLVKKYTDTNTKKINHIGLRTLLEDTADIDSTDAFYNEATQELNSYQKIIDLEQQSQRIPFEALKKITEEWEVNKKKVKKPLNDTDKEKIKQWIEALNTTNPPEKILRKGIDAIFQQLDWSFAKKIELHVFLENPKDIKNVSCKIYEKPDPKITQKASLLLPGTEVNFAGTKYVIGRNLRIGAAKNRIYAFSLENESRHILLMGNNPLTLPIQIYKCGLLPRTPHYTAILRQTSPDGLYALLRNHDLVQGYEWKLNGREIAPSDIPRADAIAAFLKDCLHYCRTHIGLKQKLWFFTDKNQLATLDPLELGRFDFNALEDFAIHCAGGNEIVRRYLFTKSNIIKDDIARFYKKVITNHLKGIEIDEIQQLALHDCDDPKIIQRAQELKVIMSKRLEEKIVELQHLHQGLEPHQIKQMAIDAVLKDYTDSMTISHIRAA